ncbi:hypothetical protein DNHGIG_23930 [Collibacillus ludicampi]|uniref:Uncharacterized protein n=1 Tax=Collibacillus ludicampi TaxID=2771369 RepID=A0AAV4LG90_9BACL|nr:hypothetical protein [Collibacillus ludicampi]GIM46844.1 hypothetical protein DNHGIG_23930 [Collibacillus ludicampi]
MQNVDLSKYRVIKIGKCTFLSPKDAPPITDFLEEEFKRIHYKKYKEEIEIKIKAKKLYPDIFGRSSID